MELPSGFMMKIAKTIRQSEEKPGMMSIIIRRPYVHLEKELRRAFKGQEDVKVIVDKRYGERRTGRQTVEIERRRAGRRNPKEQLVEAVMSI